MANADKMPPLFDHPYRHDIYSLLHLQQETHPSRPCPRPLLEPPLHTQPPTLIKRQVQRPHDHIYTSHSRKGPHRGQTQPCFNRDPPCNYMTDQHREAAPAPLIEPCTIRQRSTIERDWPRARLPHRGIKRFEPVVHAGCWCCRARCVGKYACLPEGCRRGSLLKSRKRPPGYGEYDHDQAVSPGRSTSKD